MHERRSELNTDIVRNAQLAQEYLDIAEVLIMALDDNYNVTMINQKGASILGYPKNEIIGKNFMENFLPKRIQEEIKQLGENIIEEKKEFQRYYENPILTKDGKERLISWKNTQLKDDNGKPIGILTSGEDITELRKQQEQILQKSRLEQMGEMLSMIAHQWRQPLGAISSVTTGIQVQAYLNNFSFESQGSIEKLNSTLFKEMEKINTYVQNLSKTIDDFRNFYKPNKELETVKLEEVVVSALKIINDLLKDRGIALLTQYESEYELEIIFSEMTQVVLSILQNTQDNFEEKKIQNPEIKIIIRDKIISIYDNGGGIPENIIENIFDPYFSTKENQNGTGLGLYMARTVVQEHHKGKLYAENINDGVCFHIDLNK